MKKIKQTAEYKHLLENLKKVIPIENWGPYLSERQWGTVREDYSPDGMAWQYFPFDHAHLRAYRWGEDGIGGISDLHQNLCFAPAFWNGKDPILKERLFGLSNPEGNHGEDVKELYYFLNNTPTHSYMKYRYKYTQNEYPYSNLREENGRRSKTENEYELLDTNALDNEAYFDIDIEYAKKNSEDILIKITVTNRNIEAAELTVLPTLWYRNTWFAESTEQKPDISFYRVKPVCGILKATGSASGQGEYYFHYEHPERLLFTENETNTFALYGEGLIGARKKDFFHQVIVNNLVADDGVMSGTKSSPVYKFALKPGETKVIKLRLSNTLQTNPFDTEFDSIFSANIAEATAFYEAIPNTYPNQIDVQQQALVGLLWSKQYYQYDVEKWLSGDEGQIAPPQNRYEGRNARWKHLKNSDIISMPDTWEYPWYASWDLAFHCIPMAMIDPVFAKNQLLLITREWYMSPDGQIPAYEWNFSDLNPPVQAWAGIKVYQIEKALYGKGDTGFLKRLFQKLLINFTWWLNREDKDGNTIFTGGFMGLDNISAVDRSKVIPNTNLEQADATGWMGLFALNMLEIAHEISAVDRTYEDMVIRFYEHFCMIGDALGEQGLWNEQDNFFYDVLKAKNGEELELKVRSIVGVVALFGVTILEKNTLDILTGFSQRIKWFKETRTKENDFLPIEETAPNGNIMISLLSRDKLEHIIDYLIDEDEFLSPSGLRALSKFYDQNPYRVNVGGDDYVIDYEPGESTNNLFGGNSNWRGPIWFPINYLIIKSLKKIGSFYGDTMLVEFPRKSGNQINLVALSQELTKRLLSIFEQDTEGKRKVHGRFQDFYAQEENQELILFYEYFHGNDGHGIGASHQTGWTALIAELMADLV